MDIKLTRDTHDLDISYYDLSLIDKHDSVAQAIKQNLRFFFGEWYLAVDEGVPYFQEIFVKGTNILTVESYLKKAITISQGVRKILAFSLDYSQVERRLIVMFKVDTIFGSVEGEVQL